MKTMISKNLTKWAIAVGLALGVVAAPILLSGEAEAQYRTRYQEWQYETKRPVRGYEGFPFPGIYCSYRREPNRVCSYDKRGREKCRIKSWTLVQWCS